ncbi:MAG: cytochrome c peroxidase [Polyangiaceae bacterium]
MNSSNRRQRSLGVCLALPLLLLTQYTACSADRGAPAPDSQLSLIESVTPSGFPPGRSVDRAPTDNALTEARARLGRRLFYDSRLSRTTEVSCASCHQQEHAFADPSAVSKGVEGRLGSRNASALANAAWGRSFFWDGRAPSLEEQAGQPIENPLEMDLPLAEAAMRLNGDARYVAEFASAYGEPPTALSLQRALASFVRALVSGQSAYDRHLRGDNGDFGEPEQRGEALFFSDQAACFHCHPVGVLSNEGFFNNGTYTSGGDAGRKQVTERVGDEGKFKVPGLRNCAESAPYMHDGSLPTLEAVIEQYDRGGRGDPTTDPQIAPLSLSREQKADLLAFLVSLSDPNFLTDPRYAAPAPD